MQIAGTACGTCGGRIVSESEARSCRRCAVAFHARCLTEPETCPRCRSSFELAAAFEERNEERDLEERMRTGRAIVLFLIALHMLGPVLQIGAVLAGVVTSMYDTQTMAIRAGGVFLFNLAICAALYWGSAGARSFLRFVAVLGCALTAFGVWRALEDGEALLAVVRGWACAVYAFLFWALALSESVDLYLKRGLLARQGAR